MTAVTSTIEIAGTTIRTRTARQFIVVAYRERDMYVVREDREFYGSVIRTHDRAEAERVAAEAEGRRIDTYVAFAEVRKRSDSYATAAKEAERIRSNGTAAKVYNAVAKDWA